MGDQMLDVESEELSTAPPPSPYIRNLASLSRSHWLSTRMSAQPIALVAPIPVPEPLPELGATAERPDTAVETEPVEIGESHDPSGAGASIALVVQPEIDAFPSEIDVRSFESLTEADAEPSVVAAEAVNPPELAEAPVVDVSDNDLAPASDADVEEEAEPHSQDLPAERPRKERRFGAGALVVSGLAGAATAFAAVLAFGVSHGRWERAVEFQAFAEAIEPMPSEPPAQQIKFAEAVIGYDLDALGIATGSSDAPGSDSKAKTQSEKPEEANLPVFSSVTLGTSIESGLAIADGTVLASVAPILASEFAVEEDLALEDERAYASASFQSYQVAGVFEPAQSPAAGAVLSDSGGAVDAPAVPATGKLVIDRLSGSDTDRALDGETAILSIPAGAKKVDAMLQVVAADGRLTHVSRLSVVVVGDKARAAPGRPVRKSAQRKTPAPTGKAADNTRTEIPARKPVVRPIAVPVPVPALPPRGLFNFGGLTKDGEPDLVRVRAAAG